MKINAQQHVDVLALERDEEVSALVELTAPPAPLQKRRPPVCLVTVIDRSGSMRGQRLAGAKDALCSLVDRLAPTDQFGVVAFDDAVTVPVPAAALTDKPRVKRAIQAIESGGTTDLAAGFLRGLQEARRVARDAGASVLLISDGHANAGLTDPDALADVAAAAAGRGVTTSALGFGLGYDETLLSAIAKGGRGNELFAEEADTAGALIAGEVEGLLQQSVQAASLLVRMSPHVRAVQLVNEMPAAMVDDGLLVELGGFYADESRRLLLRFAVPGMPALGLAEIATLELRYVEMPKLREQVVRLPVHVNVVPGDQAAGRILDPVVTTEIAYQEAQRAKRRATARLTAGDSESAVGDLAAAKSVILAAMDLAPAAAVEDLREEAATLDRLVAEAQYGDFSRAAKFASMDLSLKSRQRGRRRPGAGGPSA
jgi:Ca-activated chloride channel family protein